MTDHSHLELWLVVSAESRKDFVKSYIKAFPDESKYQTANNVIALWNNRAAFAKRLEKYADTARKCKTARQMVVKR